MPVRLTVSVGTPGSSSLPTADPPIHRPTLDLGASDPVMQLAPHDARLAWERGPTHANRSGRRSRARSSIRAERAVESRDWVGLNGPGWAAGRRQRTGPARSRPVTVG